MHNWIPHRHFVW